MNKYKKIMFICSVMIFLMATFCVTASANNFPDFDASGSITIHYDYEGKGIPNVAFQIYKIADLESGMRYNVLDEYQDINIDFTQLYEQDYWISIKDALEHRIDSLMLEPTKTILTNDYGAYKVEGLSLGLYIIQCDNVLLNPNKELVSEASMIMIGQFDSEKDGWIYEFDVYPKISVIEHKEYISITVNKIWNNVPEQVKLPEFITAQLICDGEVYDEVILNDQNKWCYTWDELESDHTWTVLEKEQLKDYTVQYSEELYAFEIENTYIGETPKEDPDEDPDEDPEDPQEDPSEDPEDPTEDPDDEAEKLPQTGSLMLVVQFYAGLGLLFVIFGIIYNVVASRGRQHHEA